MLFFRPAPLVCSTHYLLSEVLKSRPELNILNRVDETPETVGDLRKFEDDDGEADDYRLVADYCRKKINYMLPVTFQLSN